MSKADDDLTIFCRTPPDRDNVDCYDQYRLDLSSGEEIVILEHVIPRAHLSFAPNIRRIRSMGSLDFPLE